MCYKYLLDMFFAELINQLNSDILLFFYIHLFITITVAVVYMNTKKEKGKHF